MNLWHVALWIFGGAVAGCAVLIAGMLIHGWLWFRGATRQNLCERGREKGCL